MKLGCCSGAAISWCLLLLLLFIAAFQASDAVECKRSSRRYQDGNFGAMDTVECPKSCAAYGCNQMRYHDCPSEFPKHCSQYIPKAVKFVQDHNPDKITYEDGSDDSYMAGWVTDKDFADKVEAEKEYKKQQGNAFKAPTPENPFWYCAKPGDQDSCAATPEDSNSGNSNGFIKLTGIMVAAGWILAHL